LAARIIAIVGAPVGVDCADALPGFLFVDKRNVHDIFDAVFRGGPDEGADDVCTVLKEVVGTASDDDTGAFFIQLHNDLGLVVEEVFVGDKGAAFRRDHTAAIAVGEGIQEIFPDDFVGFPEKVQLDAAVFRSQVEDFTIVIGNVQFVGQQFSDCTAAASIASCNGKHAFFHRVTAFSGDAYSPRYAFLIDSLLSRSCAGPDNVMLPVSST